MKRNFQFYHTVKMEFSLKLFAIINIIFIIAIEAKNVTTKSVNISQLQESEKDSNKVRAPRSIQCEVNNSELNGLLIQLNDLHAKDYDKYDLNCKNTLASISNAAKSLQSFIIKSQIQVEKKSNYKNLTRIYNAEVIKIFEEIIKIPNLITSSYYASIKNTFDAIKDSNSKLELIRNDKEILWSEYLNLMQLLYNEACDDLNHFPTNCGSVTTDLNGLKYSLTDSFQFLADISYYVYDTDLKVNNVNSTSSCQFSTISELIVELKSTINNVLSPESIINKLALLNSTHGKRKSEKSQQLDDLRKDLKTKFYKRKIDFENEVKELKNQVSISKSKNEKLLVRVRKIRVQFCITRIQCGDFEMAYSEFLKFSGSDEISLQEIISGTFDNDVKILNNLLIFTHRITDFEQKALVYQSIFDLLQKTKQLSNPYILSMYNELNDIMSLTNYSSIPETLKNKFIMLKILCGTHSKHLLIDWIEGGTYSKSEILEIRNLIKKSDFFIKTLPDLINITYENKSKNADHIINFLEKLDSTFHRSIGYVTLFNLMINNNVDSYQFVKLASDIKRDFSNNSELMEEVKTKMPPRIRYLFWKPYIYIESRKHRGYTLYGSGQGNIYTYPNHNYEGGNNQKWTVHVNGKYLRFQNVENEMYLYADKNEEVKSRHFDNEKDEDTSLDWEIYPINNARYFYFKNRKNSRILDANKREKCFTSRKCCCSTVQTSVKYLGNDNHYLLWKFK